LREIGTAVISVVLSLDEDLTGINTFCTEIMLPDGMLFLFGTSLPGYELLNASRTSANDFGGKLSPRVNTGSARE
jgi:hypothetical protein